ncbi:MULTISPECIES: HEPN domain-containing protein [unclassified Shewanella]|uniref:HEPN domain-containing protein n=1 Tax=unclassified Shewanella TaxID=196818 RepID=UPI000C81A4DB|nr:MULTISPECIES: HEPN domain-containing protein [unclassified Shewanella]MDO6678435.1 HEPN domain-containing protein [Shewanella sp. 4_MG-2023]PMH96256.1 hypothetical protein BCU55_02780 [Shewanella sp. 10N.286.48.A6]
MHYKFLKEQHRKVRDDHTKSLTIRIHRALSWLNKAEQSSDLDSKFIFHWIAFNAAYAQHIDRSILMGERGLFQQFLSKLVVLDTDKQLSRFIWQEYTNTIRVVLNNEFIFESYWDAQNGLISEAQWKENRTNSIRASHHALANEQTDKVLSIIFNRLYTLRNQLLHGGATWDSKVNRQQINDCSSILSQIVPILISIMMSHPNELWGEPIYPVIT